MNLTWHIVRKDSRRLWLPLALWLLLRLVQTALVAYIWSLGETSAAELTSLSYFAGVWGGVISGVGFILAAWLVMEDNLVSPAVFWATRPISGFRLLAAKTVGALLFLSVLPVVVMIPIWLFCGFGAADIFKAAYALASGQAVLSMAAFALACVTETSGQFLIRLILGLFILVLSFSYDAGRLSSPETPIAPGLLESRVRLATWLFLVTIVTLIVHQYATRRTGRSWILVTCGILLSLGVGAGWSWDFSGNYSELFLTGGKPAASSAPSMNFKAGQTVIGKDYHQRGRTQIRFQGTVSGVPAGDFVHVNFIRGEWTNGGDRFPLRRYFFNSHASWFLSAETIRQVAGLASENVAGAWTIDADEPNESVARARTQGMTLRLELNATLMHGQVIGELPLQVGAELQKGANCTRVAGIEHVDGKVVVILNERLPSWAKEVRAVDSYLLLDRAHAWDQVCTANETGSVGINSILVGQRQIEFLPPTHEVGGRSEQIPNWEETTVIVKVRFQPGQDFSVPLTIDPFARQSGNKSARFP